MTTKEEFAALVVAMADCRKEFVMDVDGFIYYWPEGHTHGHLDAAALRVLADELDRRNEAWQRQIDNDPTIGSPQQ